MTGELKPWSIRYTENAKNDLFSIVTYINDVLLEPLVAKAMYSDIVSAIRSLETMPYRFHIYDVKPWSERKLRIRKYLVFYLPQKTTHTVLILRIIYSGRDISKQLEEK